MKAILPIINTRKAELEASPFCKWLSSSQIGEDQFAFTPSMLFFVLGFKDILSSLKITNPSTPVEHQINTHCIEDLDHWKWYLHDLEVLGFEMKSWGDSITEVFRKIWADENEPTRALVYNTIAYIKQSKDPMISLVIIEVLEAAFAIFIKHMNIPIKKANIYNQLDYFGKKHNDKELAHTLHNEFESEELLMSVSQRDSSLVIINELFDQFSKLFNCWYKSRNNYQRAALPVVESPALPDMHLS